MATNESLKNKISTQQPQRAVQNNTLKGMLDLKSTKQKFEEVLSKKAPQFMASMLSLYNNDGYLQKCQPATILSSAMIAATLDLPIEKNLGYAYLVPYKSTCNFILGYKGYIQLALRSAQYKAINVVEVYEGELINYNRLTEELEIDFECKKSDAVIGYAGYFRLLNGYEKTVYWTKEQVEKHRKKHSKSDFGWKNDWDAMAKKTVLRNMLSKWGILSVEMQTAFSEDEKYQMEQSFNNLDDDPAQEEENIIEANYTVNEEDGPVVA